MKRPHRIATIDIGTNTVLLLIVEENNGQINIVEEKSFLTRLGQGVASTSQLQTEAMDRTITALATCMERCRHHHVEQVQAVGTSALRRSNNRETFIHRVKKECGLIVTIIPGEAEAYLSYLPAHSEFGPNSMIIDIGGGSTELTWSQNQQLEFKSVLLGSVTLLETYIQHDPVAPDELANIRQHVQTTLSPLANTICQRNSHTVLIGIAATVTTLAAMKHQLAEYDHAVVHGTVLSLSDIDAIIHTLASKTIKERQQLAGLEAGRADVILPGAIILSEAMRLFQFDTVIASHKGLRWGLAIQALSPTI